jgi:PAS domain-containing protein
MERGRGFRLTANRVLLYLAVVVLVLLVFASALDEVEMGWDTGGAARDWVALLLVPLALAGVGYVYTSYETRRTRAVEQTRAEEARLGTFLDEMNDLIFDHNLRASQPGADVRRVAWTRTLTVLLNMSSERKRRPLKAVYELDLVSRANPIISLDQADLDHAVLSEAVLPGIDLHGVYLRSADLTGGDLRGADLSGARLDEADLSGANLSGADVTRQQLDRARSLAGTVMPDGSAHP